MNQNCLEIQNVRFAASKRNKVNNVTFNLEKEGEIICLLGPSGIGKTTILRTIAGLQKLSSGEIFLKDKSLSLFPLIIALATIISEYSFTFLLIRLKKKRGVHHTPIP